MGVSYHIQLKLRITGVNSIFLEFLLKSYFCELSLGKAEKPALFTDGRVKLKECKWLRKLQFQSIKMSISS